MSLVKNYKFSSLIGQCDIAHLYALEHEMLDCSGLAALSIIEDFGSDAFSELEKGLTAFFRTLAAQEHIVVYPSIKSLSAAYDSQFSADSSLRNNAFLVEYSKSSLLLRDWLQAGAKSAGASDFELIDQLASALLVLHLSGRVHGDIGPHSIAVDPGAGIRLFGKLLIEHNNNPYRPFCSVGGDACYSSPEQLRGDSVGIGSDIFSFSAAVFELLNGVPPFTGEDRLAIMKAVMCEEPPESKSAGEVLLKGMSKEPSNRPESLQELLDDLKRSFGSGLADEQEGQDQEIKTKGTNRSNFKDSSEEIEVTKASNSKKSKTKPDKNISPVGPGKAESLDQTLVSGSRMVIDEATGQISFVPLDPKPGEDESDAGAESSDAEGLEAKKQEEAAKLEAEKGEAEKLEAEKREAEEREEAARLEAEKEEAEKLEAEKREAEEREEAARLEAEKEEAERLEAERREAEEREEAARLEAEKEEAERVESEKREAEEREEAARLEAEKEEAEKLEAEKRAAEEAKEKESKEREEAEAKADEQEEPAEKKAEPIPIKTESIGSETIVKSNKRLSAETLFSFALPEAVQKEGEKLKSDSVQESLETTEFGMVMPSSEAQSVQGLGGKSVLGNKLVIGGIIMAVFLVSGLFFAAGGISGSGKTAEPAKKESDLAASASESKPSSKTDASGDESAAEAKSASSTDAAPQAEADSDPLLKELREKLSSSDITVIIPAIKEVGQTKKTELLPEVLELAKHPNFGVRVNVVRIFSDKEMYTEENANQILTVLFERLEEEDEIVRGFAAKALGEIGDVTALTKLRGRLDVEESDVVLANLRKAIAELEAVEKTPE